MEKLNKNVILATNKADIMAVYREAKVHFRDSIKSVLSIITETEGTFFFDIIDNPLVDCTPFEIQKEKLWRYNFVEKLAKLSDSLGESSTISFSEIIKNPNFGKVVDKFSE